MKTLATILGTIAAILAGAAGLYLAGVVVNIQLTYVESLLLITAYSVIVGGLLKLLRAIGVLEVVYGDTRDE